MNRHHQVDELLRDLDAAPDHSTSSPERTRALLEQVIATGVTEDAARDSANGATPAPVPSRPAPSRRRTRTRAALVTGGLVAAATTGLLVLPPLLGGGDPAYASWTAIPDDLAAEERPDAAEDCRDAQLDTPGGGDEYPQLDDATVAIAERRGEWITVVLSGPDGFSATCTTDASDPFGRGWIGSAGTPGGWQPLGPREVFASGLGVAHASGPLSMAQGYVGADIVGITYDSAEHGTVAATVAAGHFALWFPGDELDDDMVFDTGVPIDVTYTDGSTAEVALRFS